MSPERNWKMRIEDILASIQKIETYTRGMTYTQFSVDNKTIDAVIRNLEIIARQLVISRWRFRKNIRNWPGLKCGACVT